MILFNVQPSLPRGKSNELLLTENILGVPPFPCGVLGEFMQYVPNYTKSTCIDLTYLFLLLD